MYVSVHDNESVDKHVDAANGILNWMRDKINELQKKLDQKSGKILEVKNCNLFGQVKCCIGDYKRSNSIYDKTTWKESAELAKKHGQQLLSEVEKIHADNSLAIENNKQVRLMIETMMNNIGIYGTYQISSYLNPSTGRKTSKKNLYQMRSGWKNDLERCIIIDDGYSVALRKYEEFLEKISDYEQKNIAEDKKKEKELHNNEGYKLKRSMLEAFANKYEVKANNWKELFEHIRDNFHIDQNDYLTILTNCDTDDKTYRQIVSEIDYLNNNPLEHIDPCYGFFIVRDELVDEWKFGYTKSVVIESNLTHCQYGLNYRVHPEQGIDDCNDGVKWYALTDK